MRLTKTLPSLILAGLTTVAIGVIAPGSSPAQESKTGVSNNGISRLLNKANAINYEEIQMAKLARDKAGDNQAMLTFAKTLEGDHQANEDAVTALSGEKKVKIEGTPASIDKREKRFENLNGGQFNQAFLNEAVEGHAKALEFFQGEKGNSAATPTSICTYRKPFRCSAPISRWRAL